MKRRAIRSVLAKLNGCNYLAGRSGRRAWRVLLEHHRLPQRRAKGLAVALVDRGLARQPDTGRIDRPPAARDLLV